MPQSPPTTPPSPVPTVDQPAQDAVNAITTLVQDGEQAAEAAIIASAPVMGTPVLKQIWEAAFDWLIKFIMQPLAMYGGRVIVDAQEYFALKNAVAAQAALDAAKKTGDLNAIQNASSQVDQAVASVVNYIGATHS